MKFHRHFLPLAVLQAISATADVVRPGHGTPLTGTTITIPDSWGTKAGGNLFHSFEAFGVRGGQTVTFTSDRPGIANVISRVSGGAPSKIEGTIRSEIAGANVFLMNPSGIFFGPGAVLDVKGSFVATTADRIELGDQKGVFHADPMAEKSVLVSDPPSAFGFQSPAPAPIELAGARIEAGRTVALIGGDVTIRNSREAILGDSVVVSVGGTGRVRFDAADQNSVPSTGGFANLGEITIQNARIEAAESSGKGIGGIDLVGRKLTLDQGKVSSLNLTEIAARPLNIRVTDGIRIANDSEISSSTFAVFSGKTADILLSAGEIHLAPGGGSIRTTVSGTAPAGEVRLDLGGTLRIGAGSGLISEVRPGAKTGGGGIHVTANRIRIDGGYGSAFTGIRSRTEAVDPRGAGGAVLLNVRDSVNVLRHGSIDIITSPGSGAKGGDLSLVSRSLILGSQEPTPLPADPRNDILTGINGRTGGAGDAGSLHIQTGNLKILGGARIDGGVFLESAGPPAAGDGGLVLVSAKDILIDGRFYLADPTSIRRTGIVSFTGEGFHPATGNSGKIQVTATGSIRMLNGGLIDSSTFQTGNAGDVTVSAREILIDRGERGIFTGIGSDTEMVGGGGRAGDVVVRASGLLDLTGGGLISAATFGSGAAGNVTVTAGRLGVAGSGAEDTTVVVRNSGIVAVSGKDSSGDGGSVTVRVGDSLSVMRGGLIAARALGTGSAGTVGLDAGSILLKDGEISVLATSGAAGELRVTASGDVRIVGGWMSATSGGAGDAGSVTLRGTNIFLNGSQRRETSGVFASSLGSSSGQGGNVRIDALEDLTIRGARVAAESLGSGNAGSLLIRGGNVSLGEDARLSVFAKRGDAGKLRVRAVGDLMGEGATISANARGDGGNLRIDAGGLIHLRGSEVSAKARGNGGNIEFGGARHLVLDTSPVTAKAKAGSGGNILISTGSFFANSSPLDVSSERGAPGTVRIETIHSLSGSEETRDADWLDPDDVLQPSCAERRPDAGSSFTRGGRGGAQRLPGGHLPAFRLIQ